ncbi:hypothetical protein PACTADRAFT_5004 [Pachysolen tannophilus NRRL Y-2460]|uniref:Uncharacterized protein n=1 Tax=Pachysolen tannophilus NRRL Y-2460 TaxID=669874 RepID=A0A1E4TN84_PACTA|nr:hypothetical protein PACTADRAFT_5004 [Pachysolen tannophilus NRRL Y-2460]
MIISLLIGASNKFNNTTTVTANSNNNNGITSKIIDDLIVPMVDSLHYSYTSRCYLKTFSLRSLIIIGELFITLTESNQFYNHSNLNNSFYCEEAVTLFNKVIDNNLIDNLNKSYLMERISYVYDNYYYLSPATIKQRTEIMTTMTTEEQDQQVPNFLKKNYEKENYEILGFTRHRKSELWFKLAIRQFEEIKI